MKQTKQEIGTEKYGCRYNEGEKSKTHVQLSGWVMGGDRKNLENQARKSLDCC